MLRVFRYLYVFGFLLTILGVTEWGKPSAAAQTPVPRQTTIIVSYTEYEWWLTSWVDNAILCRIFIDHEGLPSEDEVLANCGSGLLAAWRDTPPCNQIASGEGNTWSCHGLYLFFVSSQPKDKEVIVNLPTMTVYVTLEGCNPVPPENRCDTLPSLMLTAVEPLPNERIMRIQGLQNGLPFACEANACAVPLKTTPIEGIAVEFWADSSFGDSSEHFSAQVRVVDTGVTSTPDSGGWYVDVLSSLWRGGPLASCSQTWTAFPPVGGMPDWLATPNHEDLIASDGAYYYLAGRLINQGIADASSCPSSGLLPNGYADACGLEMAKPFVEIWQNQFDARIMDVSQQSEVPAQLMKNLFAQESQFWPGIFRVPYEFGLGQITDNGADAILLWNSAFFSQFCPLVLSTEACSLGYLHLTPQDQTVLRGALALQARSDCADCPAGVDLTNVAFSVQLFADTLKANCEQVAQIVYNATKEKPGTVVDYENLWKLTLANYHAGPGCVSYAVHMAWLTAGSLSWDEVSKQFTEPCRGVIPYVEKISR